MKRYVAAFMDFCDMKIERKKIHEYLNSVEKILEKLKIDRIYMDSYSITNEECGKKEIARGIEGKCKTYELIGRLVQKGGKLEQTEDTILLSETRSWFDGLFQGDISFELFDELLKDITKDRDEFISCYRSARLRQNSSARMRQI